MRLSVLLTSVLSLALFRLLAQGQCIFNATHCTCAISSAPGLCCRYSSGTPTAGTCLVDECKVDSRTCDCSGTEVCGISACDAWKPADPNQALVLGDSVGCIYASNGASCVSLSSQTLMPSASPSPSTSSSSSTGPSPSSSPAAASPSSSQSPSASPSVGVSNSPSATPSNSLIPFICPNDHSVLNLFEFIPTGWGSNMNNNTYSSSYGPGESATLRAMEIEGCNSVLIQSPGDYFDINIHPVITTSNPTFPGYCMLEGPSRSTMSFESHIALVFESTFNFKPSTVKLWDLDNLLVRDPNNALEVIPGVWAAETAAVFGARDGNVIIPSSSLDATTELELLTYTIPTSSMNAMGLSSLPEVVVPGAQMKASNGYMDVDWATDRITTGVTFSFAEPIDTLVIVYGFSDWHWAGDTDAKIYLQSPVLECPP